MINYEQLKGHLTALQTARNDLANVIIEVRRIETALRAIEPEFEAALAFVRNAAARPHQPSTEPYAPFEAERTRHWDTVLQPKVRSNEPEYEPQFQGPDDEGKKIGLPDAIRRFMNRKG